jgi:hypothetical protein
MLVNEIVDDIEMILESAGPPMPDRRKIVKLMSFELAEIIGKGTWNWALQHFNPAIATQAGIRNYQLPINFPDNFVRGAGNLADGFACMLDNGTNEEQLTYVAPELYFTRNLRGTSNGKPADYTIIGGANGGREIFLYPAPDTNSSTHYTVDGLYQPTDWTLVDGDNRPLVTGNSPILKYAVLRRFNGDFEAKYQEALGFLRYEQAKSSKGQIRPAYSALSNYSLMRGL